MIHDYLKFALIGIAHRKTRSSLTIIGIFIGIAAVVALISLGQGMQNAINEQFTKLGADRIMIMPGKLIMGPRGMGAAKLTEKDVDIVKKVKGVDVVAPLLINTAKVEFGGETGYTYVYAVSEDSIEKMFLDMEMYEIKKGRSLRKGDKYEAVIGSLVESGFFTKDVGLRNKIKINDKEFTVVGTLKKVGARDDDSSLYILLDIAREIFNEPESISMIFVKTKRGYDVEEVSKDIEDRLKRSRGNDDFTVTSPTKLMESMSTILGIINMVLIGIAAISLLVGGIGIMNTMYTSVLERTRDIGVMKAVGAKNIDIMLIFLFESGLLGLFGGAVGIILGIGMAKTVEIYANQAGFGMLRASFSIGLILSALVFSFIIGVISGLLPTRKAARMKPVDALRYE